jgi:hypothetical protein
LYESDRQVASVDVTLLRPAESLGADWIKEFSGCRLPTKPA